MAEKESERKIDESGIRKVEQKIVKPSLLPDDPYTRLPLEKTSLTIKEKAHVSELVHNMRMAKEKLVALDQTIADATSGKIKKFKEVGLGQLENLKKTNPKVDLAYSAYDKVKQRAYNSEVEYREIKNIYNKKVGDQSKGGSSIIDVEKFEKEERKARKKVVIEEANQARKIDAEKKAMEKIFDKVVIEKGKRSTTSPPSTPRSPRVGPEKGRE